MQLKNPKNSVYPTKNPKNRLIGFREAIFGSQNGPVLPDFRLNRLIGFKLYIQVFKKLSIFGNYFSHIRTILLLEWQF